MKLVQVDGLRRHEFTHEGMGSLMVVNEIYEITYTFLIFSQLLFDSEGDGCPYFKRCEHKYSDQHGLTVILSRAQRFSQ